VKFPKSAKLLGYFTKLSKTFKIFQNFNMTNLTGKHTIKWRNPQVNERLGNLQAHFLMSIVSSCLSMCNISTLRTDKSESCSKLFNELG